MDNGVGRWRRDGELVMRALAWEHAVRASEIRMAGAEAALQEMDAVPWEVTRATAAAVSGCTGAERGRPPPLAGAFTMCAALE
jgi:hypothetical protein